MTLIFSFLAELALLGFFTLLGLSLLPEALLRKEAQTDRMIAFLVSPLIGSAVWLAVSVCLGMLLPFGRILLAVLLIVAVFWIIFRRKHLLFVKGKALWSFIVLCIAASIFILFCVIPHEHDGGVYFTASAFDHSRVALIRSIVKTGLPPVNPYFSESGELNRVVYHFGFQAFAAEPSILFGIPELVSGAGATGLSFLLMLFVMGALIVKLTGKTLPMFFLFVLVPIGPAMPLLEKLPESVRTVIFPKEDPGFWSVINNSVWTPHNNFAVAAVLLILILYTDFLFSESKKDRLQLAALLGFLAGASFFNSIYAGVLALGVFVLTVFLLAAFSKPFRKKFSSLFPYQLAAAGIALALSAVFLLYLFMNGGDKAPIAFGIMPAYQSSEGFLQIVGSFFQFYLIELPVKIGVPYLFGLLALTIPGVLPKGLPTRILRVFIGTSYLLIFFIHSTVYTNDFGWRMSMPAETALYLLGAILLWRIFACLWSRKKALACVFAAVLVALPVAFSQDLVKQVSDEDVGTETHVLFANAAKGWKTVQANTDGDDLVLCNPEGFADMYSYTVTPYTNYLFTYYADRNTPIADAAYTITSFSGGWSEEYVKAKYARVVAFFAGNPDADACAYIADELKTKALLITPRDGLWNAIGELETQYKLIESTPDYRVYLAK